MDNDKPKFEQSEYLTYRQIMGHFSREAARLSKGSSLFDEEEVDEAAYIMLDIEEKLHNDAQNSDAFE